MEKTKMWRRVGAFLVAGALSLGSAVSAMAIDPDGSWDPTAKGSVTVHKYFGDPVENGKANGTEETVTGRDPLGGVKFKIEKVTNVDLKTNQGWKDAEAIQKGTKKAEFAPGTEKTTGNDGIAKFDNLEIGLYRVTETDASQAKKNGTGDPVSVKTAAPFFVTVPMTNPDDRSKWMYDVHVYPKNQSFTVEKKEKVIAGDKVQYTVVATLPKLESGKKYEKYNLIDQLSDKHDVPTFNVEKIEAIKGSADNSPTNIELANVNVDKTTDAAKNLVYVRFTADGLKKLDEVSAAGKTEIRYTYTVNIKKDVKEGTLSNKAYVAPSNEYEDKPSDNTPNGSTEKKFVQFQIQKQDATENTKKLEGAEFDLYACNSDGKFLKADGTTTTNKAEAIKLNEAKMVTKGTDGKTDPVRVPVANATEKDMQKICAVETKAPKGYTLLTEPVAFEVNWKDGSTTNAVLQGIDNVKDNAGWKLPLTGANALIALSIAGVLLIAGSIAIPFARRRSKES